MKIKRYLLIVLSALALGLATLRSAAPAIAGGKAGIISQANDQLAGGKAGLSSGQN